MGGVVLSPNIRKEKVFIDPNGNEVKPYTKEIVKRVEPDYVPPVQTQTQVQTQQPQEQTPVETKPQVKELTISEQIEAAKRLLLDLEKKKKQQIADMKKQLEELEKL